jgi:hypothetical protein
MWLYSCQLHVGQAIEHPAAVRPLKRDRPVIDSVAA